MISSQELAEYAQLCDYILVHKYTRNEVTSAADDDWNMAATSDGTSTVDVACNYVSAGNVFQRPDGTVIKTEEPTLTVKVTDPLDVRDKVTNIKGSDGTVLLAGPLYVKDITYAVGFGSPTLKLATLQSSRPTEW